MSLARIVVTRRLPAPTLALLRARGAEVVAHDSDEPASAAQLLELAGSGGGAHAIICLLSDKINAEVIAATCGRLRAVATMSVGYSHIDIAACVAAKVRVGFTPGVLTDATADLALALTLSVCRRLPEAAAAVRDGSWTSWKPFWLCGSDLHHKRVGIVGMGRIGEAAARRFRGFDCTIAYTGRSGPKPALDAAYAAQWLPLDELLATSDVVVLLCALTPETTRLIGARELALMRDGAVLVNCARGEVIDQPALVDALRARPALRAGLDVCTPEPLPLDSPLLTLPNCLVLPHIGSASTACREDMATISAHNALAGCGLREGSDAWAMLSEVPETEGLPRGA